MKKKFSKILGVGLTLVLVFALTAGFSLPVGASPDENEWETFDYPIQGEDGGWFYEPAITGVIAIDQAINGDLYAYVDGLDDVFLSTDGGRSWSQTDYVADVADHVSADVPDNRSDCANYRSYRAKHVALYVANQISAYVASYGTNSAGNGPDCSHN